MDNLNSVFDKALDSVINGLEGTSLVDRARAAASDLLSEEYKAPLSSQGEGAQTANLSNLQDIAGFWRLFNLQERKRDLAEKRSAQAANGSAGSAADLRR